MDIISKIKKLLELANIEKNSNLEEAASAAAKAQKLMEKHRIQTAMLKDDFSVITKYLEDKGKPNNWKLFLASVLAKNNGCYIIKSQEYEIDNKILIAGIDKDISTVQFLYTYIVGELNRMCLLELLKFKTDFNLNPITAFVNSFYLGATSIIDQRLQDANRQIRDGEIKNAVLPEEKILLNYALQKIDSRVDLVKNWIKENLKAQIEKTTLNSSNTYGYTVGKNIAKDIDLLPDKKLK